MEPDRGWNPLFSMQRPAVDTEFADFAHHAWPRLVRSAILVGADPHSAQDPAQTVLVSCLRRWRKVGRLADSPHAYAHRSLLHELARMSEMKMVPTEGPPDEVGHPSEQDRLAVADVLLTALQGLPAEQRLAVVCTYYLDMPDSHISDVLNVPIGTLKSGRSRAIAALSNNAAVQDLAP